MLETGVGRAANLALASLPNFSLPGDISATDRYYAEDITRQHFRLNPDSTITVPEAPGLGVELAPEELERATLEKLTVDQAR
jgi:O-succinylbenzoate synthase